MFYSEEMDKRKYRKDLLRPATVLTLIHSHLRAPKT